jgi:hypothetical protein
MAGYQAGLTEAGMFDVMVELDGHQRKMRRPRRLTYNVRGESLYQYGPPMREWSGTIEVDSESDMELIRALHDARIFYWLDDTPAGPVGGTLQVYWAGPFRPVYEHPDAIMANIPFYFVAMEPG